MIDFVVGNKVDVFGQELAKQLGCDYIGFSENQYPDGDPYPLLDPAHVDRVRGKSVLVATRLQQSPSVESTLRVLHYGPRVIRSLKRTYKANSVKVLLPYYTMGRQDKNPTTIAKDKGKDRGFDYTAELFSHAGASEMITFNPHFVGPSTPFRRMPLADLNGLPALVRYIKQTDPHYTDSIVVSPDKGSSQLAWGLAKELGGIPYSHLNKVRHGDRTVEHIDRLDAGGRRVIFVDDIISTGGTVRSGVDAVDNHDGIRVAAVHGILPKPGPETMNGLLAQGKIVDVVVTDTIQSEFSKATVIPELVAHLNDTFKKGKTRVRGIEVRR